MTEKRRRVATYERVSSDDQRERETIKTQSEVLAQRLATDPNVELVDRYVDDGVSGRIPMANRPEGARLLNDAAAGRFDEVWVYRFDRLGRDDIDPLMVRRQLTELGVVVFSATEGSADDFTYGLHVLLAAKERRDFLKRSADGMARAARDGRYTGGIVPLGYRVEGRKPHARLVPSELPMWGNLTEADVVRKIYHHLAIDGWSCRQIAQDFNALGIPTAYQKDGRGARGKSTQGLWRAGRIRNLVVNTVYRGELQYGRRSTQPGGREVLSAAVEPLVSDEVWHAAQRTLERYRLAPTGGLPRTYLLRSVVTCGICGLNYCGAGGRPGQHWYRCNGYLVERGPLEGRCPSKAVRGEWLEEQVWADIERWLRDPGPLVDELDVQTGRAEQRAVAEAERITLEHAEAEIEAARERAGSLCVRGKITEAQLDQEITELDREQAQVRTRLAALRGTDELVEDASVSRDLIAEIRTRLDAGLDTAIKQKLVQLLCRVVVHTTTDENGQKTASVSIQYRFPSEQDHPATSDGVVSFSTGRGSWHKPT